MLPPAAMGDLAAALPALLGLGAIFFSLYGPHQERTERIRDRANSLLHISRAQRVVRIRGLADRILRRDLEVAHHLQEEPVFGFVRGMDRYSAYDRELRLLVRSLTAVGRLRSWALVLGVFGAIAAVSSLAWATWFWAAVCLSVAGLVMLLVAVRRAEHAGERIAELEGHPDFKEQRQE